MNFFEYTHQSPLPQRQPLRQSNPPLNLMNSTPKCNIHTNSQAITAYLPNFPIKMAKQAGNNGSLSHPPAKHKVSPTTGNQVKNSVQIPFSLMTFSAFCLFADKCVAIGNFLAARTPKPHVVIAPSVLPIVATMTTSST